MQKGSLGKMAAPGSTLFGIVTGLNIRVPATGSERRAAQPEIRLAELELIGEADAAEAGQPAAFRRGVAAFPAPGDAVLAASPDDIGCVYAPPAGATVRIGALDLDRSQPTGRSRSSICRACRPRS